MNEVKGRVIGVLPNGLFRVRCIDEDILCNLSRDILENDKNPRILINDIVIVRLNYTLYGGMHKLLNGTIVSLPVLS